MKLFIFFFIFSIYTSSLLYSQNVKNEDFSAIRENDIYSNFYKNDRVIPDTQMFSVSKYSSNFQGYFQNDYEKTISIGDGYYKKQDFRNAVFLYNKAIKDNHDSGKIIDRFKIACCYTNLKEYDSAFIQLFRIAQKGRYTNINELQNEKYLNPLHKEKRWKEIIEIVNNNRQQILIDLNKELIKE